MKKIISTLILLGLASVASYFLSHEKFLNKDCQPYKQENSLIKIDLSDYDEDDYYVNDEQRTKPESA